MSVAIHRDRMLHIGSTASFRFRSTLAYDFGLLLFRPRIDNLHLTVARGYVTKLLANGRVTRWLENHRQEYLGEFQKIAEIDSIAPFKDAPEP
ncbi:hypothetical protein AGR3A_pa20006 [Agrobacterium tomkonis CFBP 6623]|uniref:Uncharacterized protein n=2 Tax=Agrobacterium TaxID=357 RepID=A0A1S7SA05_9HYPH|nr:hypothetical protein AGR3A_pa20006 [Agrobacterium tomkonis CFBP 6623]